MEDVEFFRRLQRRGRVICSEKRILASPRRYQTIGPVRLTLAYGLIARFMSSASTEKTRVDLQTYVLQVM